MKRVLVVAVSALGLFYAEELWACAVCYGDPNSPMTKGIEAGVLVLVGCIYTVLGLMASAFVYWTWRHTRLGQTNGVVSG